MSLSLKDTEAGIKLNGALVNNLRFADNIGVLARSGPELQDITSKIDETSRKFDLMIKAEKSKTMGIEKRKEKPLRHTSKEKISSRSDSLSICLPIGGLINADCSNEKD